MMKCEGVVYLVGSGPGDIGLITVKALELIKYADCIVCDKLANSLLLKHAKADAEIIHVHKRTQNHSVPQDEINVLLVNKAKEGKKIVRLKGGDPCIFARGGEEAAFLARAGIRFEIVPGITSGIAAAEYAGIFLTDRNYSSQVMFVTGREADGKQGSSIDWKLLARFNGTIVFYMAMENLENIAGKLIAEGIDKSTKVCVIQNATLPYQRAVEGTICEIADKCVKQNIEAPAIVIIGAQAHINNQFNWFMTKPLFNKNILITRDEKGNLETSLKILKRCANPIAVDTIKISKLIDSDIFLHAAAEIKNFDWIIFTSRNGVEIFFEGLETLKKDARVFGNSKIAAIGKETASALEQKGIKPDFVPTVFTSVELGRQLAANFSLNNKKILLLRSEHGDKQLSKYLCESGAKIKDVSIYTIESNMFDAKDIQIKITQNSIDWITFASPSAVKSFFAQVPPDLINKLQVRIASVGPVTSNEIINQGAKVFVQASEHTIDGLLDALEGTYK